MMLAAGDVLSSRNGSSNTNVYAQEAVLTPSNVTTSTFGKIFDTALDGQVYAQPLVKNNVNVTAGSSLGIHNVVYVATMHDSLYALDANTGAILWQDSFTGAIIVPRLSGETVTTLPQSDTQTSTITAEIGILSTPVIDPASNLLFLLATTKEKRYKDPANQALGQDTHYVQRLYGVDVGGGSVVRQTVVGDTIYNGAINMTFQGFQYVAGPVINGTGNNGTVTVNGTPTQFNDGWIANADGYSPQAQGQIAFNAFVQLQRPGLTLLNGVIYLGFASHGDHGPYYGWLLGYRTTDLANVVVFNTIPNHEDIIGNSDYTAQAGLWTGGAPVSTDGTYLYVATGNGTFDPSAANFDPNYFTMDGPNKVVLPLDNDYGDTILKLLPDPTVVQTVSNGLWTNGNGLRVVDYFTPTNEFVLNELDLDLNSSTPSVLPDTASVTIGGVTYNHLMVAGGKEGRIYLINRDNMGGFNYDTGYPFTDDTAPFVDPKLYDRVLGEYAAKGINGSSSSSGNLRMIGSAAYLNGEIYIALSNSNGISFNLQQFAYTSSPNPSSSVPANPTPDHTTSGTTYGGSGANFSLSANGASNAVAWILKVSGNSADALLAYNTSLGTAIYNSAADASKDKLTSDINGNVLTGSSGTKFTVPTVSNGLVYTGTGASDSTAKGRLVAYGLNTLTLATPTNVAGQVIRNGKKIHLTWTRNTTSEAETVVERSTDGTNWTTLAYLPNGANSFDDTTVNAGTQYFYRVTAINGITSSAHSTSASVPFPNWVHGDFDLDGTLTANDMMPMLTALTDLNAYAAARRLSATDLIGLGDFSSDGAVTNRDIQPLLDALIASQGPGSGSGASELSQPIVIATSMPQSSPGSMISIVVAWSEPSSTLSGLHAQPGRKLGDYSSARLPVSTDGVKRSTAVFANFTSPLWRSRQAIDSKPAPIATIDELLAAWR